MRRLTGASKSRIYREYQPTDSVIHSKKSSLIHNIDSSGKYGGELSRYM